MITCWQCDGCGGWHVAVNERNVISTYDQGVAEKFAGRLHTAQNSPYRDGMRILCDEVGYMEETAKQLMYELHNGESTQTRNAHMH